MRTRLAGSPGRMGRANILVKCHLMMTAMPPPTVPPDHVTKYIDDDSSASRNKKRSSPSCQTVRNRLTPTATKGEPGGCTDTQSADPAGLSLKASFSHAAVSLFRPVDTFLDRNSHRPIVPIAPTCRSQISRGKRAPNNDASSSNKNIINRSTGLNSFQLDSRGNCHRPVFPVFPKAGTFQTSR